MRRQKGTGYLKKREDGRKTLTKSVIDPFTGKAKKFRVTENSEAACRQILENKIEAWRKRQSLTIESMTVTELCKLYLSSQVEQGVIKPSSRDRNMCSINNQVEGYKLGEMDVRDVTPKHIDEHFTRLFVENKLSASTIEKAKYVIDAAFRWAVNRGELERNPVDSIRKSIDRRIETIRSRNASEMDVVVLTEEQAKVFREEALRKTKNGRYKYPIGLYCVLLLETGMRCGEMLALRWSDYDEESGILQIEKGRTRVRKDDKIDAKTGALEYQFVERNTKNQRARNIQLTSEAIRVLAEIYTMNGFKREKTDYLCLSRTGKPRCVTDVEKGAGTIYRNAGIPKEEASGVHILRRTFATNKRRAGWTVAEIAAYLGDLESTVSKYYIADRNLQMVGGKKVAVVPLPM